MYHCYLSAEKEARCVAFEVGVNVLCLVVLWGGGGGELHHMEFLVAVALREPVQLTHVLYTTYTPLLHQLNHHFSMALASYDQNIWNH